MKNYLIVLTYLVLIAPTTSSSFAQWVQTSGPADGTVVSFAVSGTNIFAGTYVSGASSGGIPTGCLFRSQNNGTTWDQLDGMPVRAVLALAVSVSNLFLGASGTGVWESTDNGSTWRPLGSGSEGGSPPYENTYVYALAIVGTNLFSGVDAQGVFLSTDDGLSWARVDSGLGGYPMIDAFAVSGSNLFVGTADGGVYLATTNGQNWRSILHTNSITGLGSNVLSLYAYSDESGDTCLFVGLSSGGIYMSTDNGQTWTEENTGLTNHTVNCFTQSGKTIFVGTNGGGVFEASRSNLNWTEVNTGLTDLYVKALAATDTFLYAGATTVFRRPLSELIAGLKEEPLLPARFALYQNYPNPFNPSTVINYQLPTNSLVVLKVFDVLGREVTTLVNERQSDGNHYVRFSASNVPSGVYFYRLQAGTSTQTKKLTILK